MSTAPTPKAVENTKRLEALWGKTLISAGFTALPDVIFQNQKALKLKPLDVLIVLHIASYWREPGKLPWPAKATIAAALDVTGRTVQRSIAKMEKLGYVTRIERKHDVGDNMTNMYDLRGFIAAAEQLAKDKLALREKRAAEDKAKRETPIAFELITGGNTKP